MPSTKNVQYMAADAKKALEKAAAAHEKAVAAHARAVAAAEQARRSAQELAQLREQNPNPLMDAFLASLTPEEDARLFADGNEDALMAAFDAYCIAHI